LSAEIDDGILLGNTERERERERDSVWHYGGSSNREACAFSTGTDATTTDGVDAANVLAKQ